ncbi:spore gernimation protein GerT [Metabacillus fastidiosus]|uniref:Hsp20/alpha crystallin family protein n=1 Tax=Metabacillus fastidiosus TaxID=1458 RepID=UPI002E1DE059|nr:spore gernimation protein GerT [Metabacillus fastidiosus]
MFPWNNKIPLNGNNSADFFKNMNPSEVENYIQHVMKSVFGGDFSQNFPFQGDLMNSKQKNDPYEIFETSDFIYVKIPMKEELLSSVKIQHTASQLIIANYPTEGKQKKIMLPSSVKRKGTRAKYKNKLLEIRLLRNEDHHFSEIPITNYDE